MKKQGMRPGGFTLIELLVVVAIISVLAGLVMPLYSRSMAITRSTGCLSNLRQIGIALTAYLGDHKMIMPSLQAGRNSTSDDVPVIDNTLNQYAPDPRIFACPADNQNLATKTGTSYYWNNVLDGQSVTTLSFLNIQGASLVPVLVDKAAFHPNSAHQVNLLYADGHASKDLTFYSASN